MLKVVGTDERDLFLLAGDGSMKMLNTTLFITSGLNLLNAARGGLYGSSE